MRDGYTAGHQHRSSLLQTHLPDAEQGLIADFSGHAPGKRGMSHCGGHAPNMASKSISD